MERWVQKAEKYKSYAQRSLEEEAYDLACFLAQQSAEFLLKGVLIREVGAKPLTHSLYEMAKRLGQVRAVELSEDVAKCAKSLEEHYVQVSRRAAGPLRAVGGRGVSALPRDVVEMDRWVEVAKRRRREIAAAVAAFIKEACRVGDVVLFGSRARGDFHDMSDWDLAVVTQDGEYAVETEEFGQVVYIPLSKLRQLLAFSMLILDVAYEGHLLCGRGEFWQEFTREVMQYIRERRLGKNRWGWYPL